MDNQEQKITSHTPGPWPTPRKSGDWKRIIIEEDGDGWHRLAVYVDSDDCDSDTAMANARLIAAAPELLAALQAVVRVADRATVEFDVARAAIAKATTKEGN